MLAYCSDRFVLPLPAGHSFPAGKYARLRQAVVASVPEIELCEAQPASEGELALVHEPSWIDAVLRGTMSAAEQREVGFPWSEAMVQRSLHSVGATVAAARSALFGGEWVAATLAGGTHHAQAHKGSGWCVFNDVAVAARLMQAEWHRVADRGRAGLKVWVIDLDVHQGNGTASIFRDDESVFTFSMHAARNFPFRKEASSLDIELADGCADAEYLDPLDRGLADCWQRMREHPPGLAFYLAGADAHEHDRLGRLRLTTQGLAERDRRVFAFLGARGVPVAVCMAGGYGRDIAVTVQVHCRTLAEALAAWRERRERSAGQVPTRFLECPAEHGLARAAGHRAKAGHRRW